MKVLIIVLICVAIIVTVGYWLLARSSRPLPAAKDIEKIIIAYNSEHYDDEDDIGKEFEISNYEEIYNIREKIGDIKLNMFSTASGDGMEEGRQWIINVYYKSGEYRFFYVDENEIMGTKNTNSPLFRFLNDSYR